MGVQPSAAGQPTPQVPVPSKGNPSLTASVHMPSPGRRPLNLIRERAGVEAPSAAQSAAPPKSEPGRHADRLTPDLAPKQDLFWDSLLSRPVAPGPSQPTSLLREPVPPSKAQASRPEVGSKPVAESKRNLLVEALSPSASAPSKRQPKARPRIPAALARLTDSSAAGAESELAPAVEPKLKPAPVAKKKRKRPKRKPTHQRLWEAAETLLFDSRVTAGAVIAFVAVTGLAIFNSSDPEPSFVPTRAVQIPSGADDPLAAISPRAGSSITDDSGSWISRLLSPLERRASKYIVDEFGAGISDWTDSSALHVLQDGLRVTSGLALRKSTLELDDYRFEFEAKMEAGGVGWVVRAADEFDHYAFKFDSANQLKRYAVIGGQAQRATTIEAPAGLFKASGFNRVLVQVKGERMMTMINGLGVDFWKDKRIQRGGVGFLADSGESALVRKMVLVANDDALGMVLSGAIETIRSFQGEPDARAAGPGIPAGPVAFLIVKLPYRGPSIRPYGLLPRPRL